MATEKIHTILLKCIEDCKAKSSDENYKHENQPLIDWSEDGSQLIIASWDKFFNVFQPDYFTKSTATQWTIFEKNMDFKKIIHFRENHFSRRFRRK